MDLSSTSPLNKQLYSLVMVNVVYWSSMILPPLHIKWIYILCEPFKLTSRVRLGGVMNSG